jgi:hypothetical protein
MNAKEIAKEIHRYERIQIEKLIQRSGYGDDDWDWESTCHILFRSFFMSKRDYIKLKNILWSTN